MKNIDNNIENILKIEGVNAQGYGIIPQAVMFDDRLSPQSKAIYAYLVSYSGSGQMIFPKVTTILSHLKITKNTYYKHFKPLVDLGYIKIEKAKHYLNKNIYILSNAPKMLNYSILTSSSSGILAIDGINGKGFGFIPKLIMKDLRISIKAKALIAFFYSLVQNGYRAFPHRNTIRQIMQLSKDVYYKALNQLIDCNYITVKQRKDKKGKFSVNDYILNTNPNVENNVEINTESIPCPENYDNAESTINTQITPCHKNCDYSEINRVLKTTIIITIPVITVVL